MATPDSTPATGLSSSNEPTLLGLNPPTFSPLAPTPLVLRSSPPSLPRNGNCTHLTMTRLYTEDFRCNLCWKFSTMGWVYRCTQDRELILEEYIEKGCEEKIDVLCDIFERSSTPRKGSPAARASKMAFLEEISDENFASYTEEQLTRILDQRANVLAVAALDSMGDDVDVELLYPFVPSTSASPSSRPRRYSSSPSRVVNNIGPRPWKPSGECQFKCCHHCRPTLLERSWLSLNGIVNDDIPPTAITGYGFHLHKKRPVASVEIMKKIGLRPSPEPRPRRRRALDLERAIAQDMGLGLIDTTSESPLIPRPLPEPPVSPSPPSLSASPSTQPFVALPTLMHKDDDFNSDIFAPSPALETPLPPQSAEELVILTPMEKNEIDDGSFGSEPLEVNHGIAVTEGAVGLHVPDLITQF